MSILPQCHTYPGTVERKPGVIAGPITGSQVEEVNCTQQPGVQLDCNKRTCGCPRTSDKLKQIMGTFPAPPPPTPMVGMLYDKACGYSYGHGEIRKPLLPECCTGARKLKKHHPKAWKIVGEMVYLVQMAVTATALVLYYMIYCYMQLVYYTLRSALYFHKADGPMKVTIAVVTVTSLIIGLNLLMRMEQLLGIIY